MPRGVKKENLPSKVCVTCERPFTWRKKWEKCWDEVTTCSKTCNAKRKEKNTAKQRNERCNKEDKINEQNQSQLSDINEQLKKGDNYADSASATNNDVVDELTDSLSMVELLQKSDKEIPEEENSNHIEDQVAQKKALRKAEKKRKKEERRAQLDGRGEKTGQKQCDVCKKNVDLLIRCKIDESQQWNMVCGKCWNDVSGGVVDGDASHPHYNYGGLWKNRR